MSLKEITQEAFENYNFNREPTLLGIVNEKRWFADNKANIIGTVLIDNIDSDWSYVIMAKEEDDHYRFIDAKVSIKTEHLAVNELLSKIRGLTKNNKIEKELYNSNLFDSNSSIIVTDLNEEIKKFFKKYPQKLYDINPRKFEELIASILEDLGFDVELTQATRDGGRDIIANIKNKVTNFLAYVECKRYSPENKIGVGIIRQVSGVHYLQKPSKSIIVTTSFFTKDAMEEAKLIENQLQLRDFNNIKDWLDKY
ncbi:restriction endonuclease [Sphingobacterium kitahiroshimense]|uniref:Restriction endonuclease n=1 Tax=Sphingobacterium kitahiroshimense TaxID=470446 RepID=A0ABV0BYK4_9SPHI